MAVPMTTPGAESIVGFLELRICAESFEDMQKARIACVNRFERGGVEKSAFSRQAAALTAAENECRLMMLRTYRKVAPPGVRDWQAYHFGIGEHLVARLLGQIGHPRIATPYAWMAEPPAGHVCNPLRCGADKHLVALPMFERTVSQLRAYTGWGDASLRRVKGMSQQDAFRLGRTRAKSIVWNLAVATMKSGKVARDNLSEGAGTATQPVSPSPLPSPSPDETGVLAQSVNRASRQGPSPQVAVIPPQPDAQALPGEATEANTGTQPVGTAPRWHYRNVYDEARALYADRLDVNQDPWTPGHQHAAAIRKVAKEILRDLWIASA